MNSSAKKAPPLISSPALGMIFFILTEMMLFSALISSYNIVRSGAINWPPLGQPRLPIIATGFNTLLLSLSGIFLVTAYKFFAKLGSSAKVKTLFLLSVVLGFAFVCLQGAEWLKLIGFGMTMTSSVYGSFFYLLIGTHGLHVLGAVMALAIMYGKLKKNTLKLESFTAILIFWLFVVLLWPLLYLLVYFD